MARLTERSQFAHLQGVRQRWRPRRQLLDFDRNVAGNGELSRRSALGYCKFGRSPLERPIIPAVAYSAHPISSRPIMAIASRPLLAARRTGIYATAARARSRQATFSSTAYG